MAKNKYRQDDKFYISDLRILIYVIGYACYGESVVILIMNGNTCYYATVIDSYHFKRDKRGAFINKAVDILNENHVERLDVLCWTHPHDDHSKGITTILNKFCDEETDVIYPLYIEDNESDIVKLKHVSKEVVHKVLSDNRTGKYRANPIGVLVNRYANVDEFDIVNPYDEKEYRTVRIDAITPISSKLTSYVNNTICTNPNELSISLYMDIDDYGFYFGGDTTNEHIDASNKNRMRKCRFVKIPHHSSETAINLINYLPVDNIDAVCTSVFKWGRSKLPSSKVIKTYQKYFSDIYSTNKDFNQKEYGIIEYEYDFTKAIPQFSIYQVGNVGRLDLI